MDITNSVLQKYSKQFHNARRKKNKKKTSKFKGQQRKYIGVMVKQNINENEEIFIDFEKGDHNENNDDFNEVSNSPLYRYEAEKVHTSLKTCSEKENSLDITNMGSLDLPEIENIPSVNMDEIEYVQNLYCQQVDKNISSSFYTSGMSDSNTCTTIYQRHVSDDNTNIKGHTFSTENDQLKHCSWSNGIQSVCQSEDVLYISEKVNESVDSENLNYCKTDDKPVCVENEMSSSHDSDVHHYVETDDDSPVKHDISIYDIESDLKSERNVLPKSYRKMDAINMKLAGVSARPFRTFSSYDDHLFKKPLNATVGKRHVEIQTVEVGKEIHKFFNNHYKIRGIYLNKGKRDIKKKLVILRRQNTAIDQGSWKRGKFIHDRNRLDDYFEFTEEGQRKRKMFDKKMIRDEYVVNWYLFCPGRGNCKRKCGGYGKCVNSEYIYIYIYIF